MDAKNQDSEMFLLSAENFENEKFYVINFNGYEALNELFNFSINFACTNKSLNTELLMSSLVTFSIVRPNGNLTKFTGYPVNVEQSGRFRKYVYYHIDLRPTFWKMSQLTSSRIFLNKNIKEIITELLREEKWLYFPHEFNFVKQDYPQSEFVMQYNETNFDFICWNLEQNGAYFYFDQDNSDENNIRDKIVFCDQPLSHFSLPNINESKNRNRNKNKNKDRISNKITKLSYAEISGLNFNQRDEIIFDFKLKQSPLPKNIVVRDYNWKNPNRVIIGNAIVSDIGLGTIYLTDENVESESEANRIAKIRAEELQCHSKTYYGKSSISTLRPGFTFELAKHYNKNFNQEYLLTKVIHEGRQESFLSFGLGIPLQAFSKIENFSQNLVENNISEEYKHYYYHNNFECIQANQVYHPKRTAKRAEIKGVIRGFIDGAGDATRPEVDEFGRYKVVFPFDISGRSKGKCSCWIRRSQEQVGLNSGLNFPLLGGVEVTISFINGNPNLPVISGALANGETQSLAQSNNNNTEGIYTAGGNRLLFGNTDKKQGFALQTASGKGLVVGAGSLSQTQIVNDFHLSLTNTISTNIHGLASTNLSGMKKSNSVSAPPSFTNFGDSSDNWKALIIGLVGQTAQDILNNIAERKTNECNKSSAVDVTFASDMIKIAQTLIEVIPKSWKKGKTGDYGAILQTDKTSAKSVLEALSYSLADTVAWSATMLATSLLNVGTEIGKDVSGLNESDDYKKAKEEYEKDPTNEDKLKEYNLQKKSYKLTTISEYLNSTLPELLPELIALIMMIKNGKSLKDKRLGGILLNAAEANVTIAARDPVAMNSARGVFVNTEDLNIKKKKLDAGTLSSKLKSTNAEDIAIRTKMPKQETFKSSDCSYSNWGIADKDGKLAKDYQEGSEDFTEDADNNLKSLTGFLQKRITTTADFSGLSFKYKYNSDDLENAKVMQKRFIANQTQHIINVANYCTDIFDGQKYSVAYSYTFVTKALDEGTKKKNLTFLRMGTKNAVDAFAINGDYQPSKTGFVVDVFGATANEHSITLRAHSEAEASADDSKYQKPSSWLNLSKDVAELSVAKDNVKQMIRATNEDILIGLIPNKSDVTNVDIKSGLSVSETYTELYENNSYISMTSGNIFMKTSDSSKNKVQIDEVAIKNDTIIAKSIKSSDTGGIVDIAGVIKIVQGDSEAIEKLKDKKEKK